MKVLANKNKITIELETRLKDKRHQAEFKRLLDTDLVEAIQYAKSFNGTAIRVAGITKKRREISSVVDLLKAKRTNSILRLFFDSCDASQDHKPLNTSLGKWIGVEIECTIPISAAIDLGIEGQSETTYCEPGEGCNDCDEDDCDSSGHCEGHESGGGGDFVSGLASHFESLGLRRVSVKTDGSISPPRGHFGVEVTVLFTQNDRSALKKLCGALASLDASVNKSCGLHVHLDQRDQRSETRVKQRAERLGSALPLLASMVPESRRRNNYCRLSVSSLGGERYHAINLTAYRKYKTIEVRLHSATRDFEKISNWIDLLLLIQSGPSCEVKNLSDLSDSFDVPERLINYVESRVLKFSKPESEESAGQDQQTQAVA